MICYVRITKNTAIHFSILSKKIKSHGKCRDATAILAASFPRSKKLLRQISFAI